MYGCIACGKAHNESDEDAFGNVVGALYCWDCLQSIEQDRLDQLEAQVCED